MHPYSIGLTKECTPGIYSLTALLHFSRKLLSLQVARRCWSGNDAARSTVDRAMEAEPLLKVTIPHEVKDESLVTHALDGITNGIK